MVSRRLLAPVLCLLVLAVSCEKVPLLAPTGSTITLTTATNIITTTGTAEILAQVLEASGTPPHSGTLISFTTTLGRVEPTEVETDASGRAIVRFTATGASGTATARSTATSMHSPSSARHSPGSHAGVAAPW